LCLNSPQRPFFLKITLHETGMGCALAAEIRGGEIRNDFTSSK
jgi:hypothetical protein